MNSKNVSFYFFMFAFLSCDPNIYGTLDDHFNVDADKVSKMIVTKSNTEVTVSNSTFIRDFYSIIDGCTINKEILKGRASDKYEVIVTIDSTKFVYQFYDKNQDGFVLNIRSRGRNGYTVHHSKCHEMESLLMRIFKEVR